MYIYNYNVPVHLHVDCPIWRSECIPKHVHVQLPTLLTDADDDFFKFDPPLMHDTPRLSHHPAMNTRVIISMEGGSCLVGG